MFKSSPPRNSTADRTRYTQRCEQSPSDSDRECGEAVQAIPSDSSLDRPFTGDRASIFGASWLAAAAGASSVFAIVEAGMWVYTEQDYLALAAVFCFGLTAALAERADRIMKRVCDDTATMRSNSEFFFRAWEEAQAKLERPVRAMEAHRAGVAIRSPGEAHEPETKHGSCAAYEAFRKDFTRDIVPDAIAREINAAGIAIVPLKTFAEIGELGPVNNVIAFGRKS